MRLARLKEDGGLSLAEFVGDNIPRYAILSHTWGPDQEEVTYKDVMKGTAKSKPGYAKVQFCGKQAARDNLQYFWVDTCCINKSSSAELSEAINSMFRWYQKAERCYVYLSDVLVNTPNSDGESISSQGWELAFKKSRWFTRGWTLQEFIAPASVEFFSKDESRLGDKRSLERTLHEVTGIAIHAFQGDHLPNFSIVERMSWATTRQTQRGEDAAYSLLGIFNIHMPLIYGEGREKAFIRLQKEIKQSLRDNARAVLPLLPGKEPKRNIEDISITPAGWNRKFVDPPVALAARLYGLIRKDREHVDDKLKHLPRDSPLLASIVHTSTYDDWVRGGGVLWCSTQGNSYSSISSTIAAMIAQNLAASRENVRNTETIMIYPGMSSVGDKTSHFKFLTASHERVTMFHFLRILIVQLLSSNSNTIASLRSTIGKLPDAEYETLAEMFEDSGYETLDSLMALLESIMSVGNSPLIIAVDDAHVVADVFAKHGRDDIFKKLAEPSKSMHTVRRVHFVIGGKAEDALIEALNGIRVVDSNTEYHECLESLYFEGQHTRRDQVSTALHDTNSWIWTHPSYVSWKQDDSSILWIEGKPGSGKSVLAKEIQKRLAEDQQTYTCDWFFSTRDGQIATAHTSFMRSILFQLLQRNQSLFQHFQDVYRAYAPKSCLPWESLHATQKILRGIVTTGIKLQCLVDAMDEAETGKDGSQMRRMLLHTLSDLVAAVEQSHFKIVVCSRPFFDIDAEFSRHRRLYGSLHKIILQDENSGSICAIIDDGIDSLRNAMRSWGDDYDLPHSIGREGLVRNDVSRPKRLNPFQEKQKRREDSMLERFRSYLLANAQGVVLWVTLILSILRSTIGKGMYTFSGLEQRLQILPTELDGIYRYFVDDLRQKFEGEELAKTRRVLMFVSGGNALKPLKIEELWEALATPQDPECALDSDVDPIVEGRAHITTWKEFRWQLHAMCGPLVEIVSTKRGTAHPLYGDYDVDATDTVQILHRTAKDFLGSSDSAGPLSFSERDAAEFVKETLHAYARIVMPPIPTGYASPANSENSNWALNMENAATYLSDKRLLPWIFNTLPKNSVEKCKLLGIFYSLLETSTFPALESWSEPQLSREFGPHIATSRGLETAKSTIGAYFVDYACSNGFAIAVIYFLEILTLKWSDHIAFAIFDAALMVAIKHEMLDLIHVLAEFNPKEPECRFWEENEYNVMGKSCYLTPFEMAAAQSGNEAVATAVYDRNHRVNKKLPWQFWGVLSRGRKCWHRSREDWHAYLELTRHFKSRSQALESVSFEHVREAVQLVADYCKRQGSLK